MQEKYKYTIWIRTIPSRVKTLRFSFFQKFKIRKGFEIPYPKQKLTLLAALRTEAKVFLWFYHPQNSKHSQWRIFSQENKQRTCSRASCDWSKHSIQNLRLRYCLRYQLVWYPSRRQSININFNPLETEKIETRNGQTSRLAGRHVKWKLR